jgi:hypothetical protein
MKTRNLKQKKQNHKQNKINKINKTKKTKKYLNSGGGVFGIKRHSNVYTVQEALQEGCPRILAKGKPSNPLTISKYNKCKNSIKIFNTELFSNNEDEKIYKNKFIPDFYNSSPPDQNNEIEKVGTIYIVDLINSWYLKNDPQADKKLQILISNLNPYTYASLVDASSLTYELKSKIYDYYEENRKNIDTPNKLIQLITNISTDYHYNPKAKYFMPTLVSIESNPSSNSRYKQGLNYDILIDTETTLPSNILFKKFDVSNINTRDLQQLKSDTIKDTFSRRIQTIIIKNGNEIYNTTNHDNRSNTETYDPAIPQFNFFVDLLTKLSSPQSNLKQLSDSETLFRTQNIEELRQIPETKVNEVNINKNLEVVANSISLLGLLTYPSFNNLLRGFMSSRDTIKPPGIFASYLEKEEDKYLCNYGLTSTNLVSEEYQPPQEIHTIINSFLSRHIKYYKPQESYDSLRWVDFDNGQYIGILIQALRIHLFHVGWIIQIMIASNVSTHGNVNVTIKYLIIWKKIDNSTQEMIASECPNMYNYFFKNIWEALM